MTGIFVPDMYMPDCCVDCPMYTIISRSANSGYCYALGEEVSFADALQERYVGCKLMEMEVDNDSN